MYNNIPMLRAAEKIHDKTGISIHILNKQKASRSQTHWHDYYTIDIVLSGYGEHYINNIGYPVTPGSIFLVRPSDIHIYEQKGDFKGYFIRFTDQAIPKEYRDIVYNCSNTVAVDNNMLQAIQIYCETIKKGNERILSDDASPWVFDEVRHSFSLLLITLAKLGSLSKTAAHKTDKLANLMHYLDIHFREAITVEQAAEIACVAKSYFPTYFHKKVGVSYSEYLLTLRVKYAASLLKNGLTVTESCFSAGFGSMSHFNNIFKRILGCTASDYRKQSSDI